MYLERCVVLDCYKLKVFTKQRNVKLFTRIYITVHSQFQTSHSSLITLLRREGWITCSFSVAYLNYLSHTQ